MVIGIDFAADSWDDSLSPQEIKTLESFQDSSNHNKIEMVGS